MVNNKIYLDKEFDKFWQKIENGENFSLLRYGDGERAIMCGEHVKAQEGWESPSHISSLGMALLETLKFNNDNLYYGISCPCCDQKAYYWYSSRILSKNITFANLWVNFNYEKFYNKFSNLKRDAILIANYRAKNHQIGNLNILKHYEIDDDCISFWENNALQMIEEIKKDFGDRNNLLYVVSAGPMSEPIIFELHKNNPNNCYIDFGSSIDKYIHNKETRPYMNITTSYAKQNCWMHNPTLTDFDVSVVLNLYKRPECLEMQLNALENQTLKPKEILLYQDGTSETIKIPENIKNKFDIIEVGTENKGVWERFRFAQRVAKSKYVCIFDDDTISGSRWLENCHTEMMKQEGLYGTIGIILKDEIEKYPVDMKNSCYRVGWDGNLEHTTEVDFVGHSWFFKKEWLNYLFEAPQKIQEQKLCGEDMSFSYELLKHGIHTFVPPHPNNNKELFGSIPEFAWEFGTNNNGISSVSPNLIKMQKCLQFLLNEDWQILKKRNHKYVKRIQKELLNKNYNDDKYKCSFIQKIFSMKNEIYNEKKYKVIRFLGFKIKINKTIFFPIYDNIDVSIIIPVYNQYHYTYNCLYSIYKNVKGVNYEIILIDDCSTDKTKQIDNDFRNIKIIQNTTNQGFVKNCNIGAQQAKGKYIYLLNNDTFVKRKSIENLIEGFNYDANIAVIGSKMLNDKNKLLSIGAYVDSEGISHNYEKKIPTRLLSTNKNYMNVEYVCGASLMTRKDIWDKFNGFDEIFSPGYYEESDFCYKVRKQGYKVLCALNSIIIHFENKTFKNKVYTNDFITKNKIKFLERHFNNIGKNNNDL